MKKYITLEARLVPGSVTMLRSSIVGVESNSFDCVASNLILESGARFHLNGFEKSEILKQLEEFDKNNNESNA